MNSKRLKHGATSRRGTLLCLVGIWLCLVLAQLTPSFDMSPDAAVYLTLARSLAHGQGYTIEGQFCRAYPPMFPLMLSVVASPQRSDYRPQKLIVASTALCGLLAAYWLLSQRYRGTTLTMLSLLVALSPTFVGYATRLLSDVPFFFFTMVFMASAACFWRSERLNWPMGILSALALAVATLTRSAGAAFYLATFAWLARPSLWRADARRCLVFLVLIIVIACLPAAGWIAWIAGHTENGTDSYVSFVHSGLLRGESPFSYRGLSLLLSWEARTVPSQLAVAARAIFPVGGRHASVFWAVILAPLGFLGLVRRLRTPGPVDYCFCGYVVMVLCWPASHSTRLWLPVLPLTLGYLADGIAGFGHIAEEFPRLTRWTRLERFDGLLGRLRGSVARWGVAILLAVGIVTGAGAIRQTWLNHRNAINGVVLSGAPLDVTRFVMAPHERPLVLSYSRFCEVSMAVGDSRSRIVPIPDVAGNDGQALLREARSRGITHLAIPQRIKPASHRYGLLRTTRDLLMADPERFPTVAETKHVRIFRIAPADGAQAAMSNDEGLMTKETPMTKP